MPHVPFLRSMAPPLPRSTPRPLALRSIPTSCNGTAHGGFHRRMLGIASTPTELPRGFRIVHRYRIPRPPDLNSDGVPLLSFGDVCP